MPPSNANAIHMCRVVSCFYCTTLALTARARVCNITYNCFGCCVEKVNEPVDALESLGGMEGGKRGE